MSRIADTFCRVPNMLKSKSSIFCFFTALILPHSRLLASEDDRVTLRMLNWNTYLLPHGVDDEFGYKQERASLIADKMFEFASKYDILTLQEAYQSSKRQFEILQAATRAGFRDIAYGPLSELTKLQPVDSGLLILSKHRILDVEKRLFPRSPGKEGFITKGVVYARIYHPPSNRFVHVFNTHPVATFMNTPAVDLTKTVRGKQLTATANFIKDMANKYQFDPTDPIILGGSLNVDARGAIHEKEYEEMMHIFSSITNRDARDVIHDLLDDHPITWQYWEPEIEHRRDHPNGPPVDPPQCSDYIILFDTDDPKRYYEAIEADVEYMNVDESYRLPFSRLSDNNGLSTTISLTVKPTQHVIRNT